MQYTDNINLKKPDTTDFYDVGDFNDNADSIDEEFEKIKELLVANHFYAPIADENGNRIVDENDNEITGDWRFKIA